MSGATTEARPTAAQLGGGEKDFVDRFVNWSLNWVPDSMVFVGVLTVIVFVMALALTNHGPLELLDDYVKGFWILLTFAMQMSLLMITGFVVADSKLVKKGLVALIDMTSTPKSTMLMFCLVVGVIAWVHWGMGAMVVMVLGREIAVRKRGLGIHYPTLAGFGYAMIVIMANGPSQSAPLLAATAGNFLEKTIGGLIPMTETALSPFLLTLCFIQLVTMPIILLYMMPSKEKAVEISDANYAEFSKPLVEDETGRKLRPAERWERSRVLLTIIGAGIVFWCARFVWINGAGKMDLNTINFLFFGLGLALHGSPQSFVAAVRKGVGTTYGVIIQFPLYAGIFGLISFSGLATVITHWFISISTQGTYAWIVFFYTVIMDWFVPSGGSKLAIEAPYIIPAARELGVPVSHVINAYSTGSQVANAIQPFWMLPQLAAFHVRFQDIMPYTAAIFVYTLILSSLAFLIFPVGL